MRFAVLTPVRLVADRLDALLRARFPDSDPLLVESLDDLRGAIRTSSGIRLVVVDVTPDVSRDAVRTFRRACPEVSLLALGPRESSQDILTHCREDFDGWVRPEDGPDALQAHIECLLNGDESQRGSKEILGRLRAATGLIGSAPSFVQALEDLARFAAADVPVLIVGETGTGKELAARAVHYLSQRTDGPFIPVNCGALPERLFENELFGHGKGAFTDAADAQTGLIAHAEGGTLLLDEVDSLDSHSQVALLRFLQDRHYRPLGAGTERLADVRIVASSNACLETCASDGRFRRDLLFRLDVAQVRLPPLRERKADILPLARHYLTQIAVRYQIKVPMLSPAVADAMLRHAWPGNIRELENVMHRALLLAGGGRQISRAPPITEDADEPPLSNPDVGGRCAPLAMSPPICETLKEERARLNAAFERDYISRLLVQTAGNIAAASREAGTERRHLSRMIHRHGIDAKAFRH